MPNAVLEKSGANRGDNESEEQEQDCVAVEEGDSQAGFPHQRSSSELGNYEDEDDDNGVVPLVNNTMLNEDVPSVGNGSSNQDGKIKDVGASFREHDYIGLSDGGGSSSTTQDEKIKGKELDFGPKTKETELRLGPPPETPEASFQKNIHNSLVKRAAEHHQVPNKPELNPAAAILPVDSEGRVGRQYALNDSLQRWNRQCFGESHVGKYAYPKQTLISSKESSEPKFFNNGQEVHPHSHPHPQQDYSNNAMAFLLTPKNTNTPTAGAKRVFSDAIGVAQVVRSALNMPNEGSRMGLLMPATNAKSEVDCKVSSQQPQHQNQHQHHQHQPPLSLMYPWANAVQVPNTWQVSLEQQQQQHRGSFGTFPTQAAARVMVGNMMAAAAGNVTLNEAPHGTPSESRAKSSQESVSASAMRPPMPPPAPSERQQKNPTVNEALTPPSNGNGNGNSAASRVAPVVGWPPIRSFRKNLAPQPKPDIEDTTDASGNSYASTDPGQTFGDSMFVKVNMDGVPIGRKIDLKAYDSYDKLSQALEEMFKRFINVQGSGQRQPTNPTSERDQPPLLSGTGTDYVLTYEDNEGDRMLVGDVPWDMFVSTVKRLRIMKSSEARGLAPRQPLRPQGQVTQ